MIGSPILTDCIPTTSLPPSFLTTPASNPTLARESAVTPPADSLQHEIHATTAPEPVKQHGLQGFAHIFACGAALFSDGYVNAISGSVGTILRRFYRDTNPPAFDRFTAPWPLQVPSWACSRSESCSIK
ncbi:hypothetical protein CF335_g8267 [Tilletia laevis]|nr:hypothetical protein CF335_g8267 [Tilletia laevis]